MCVQPLTFKFIHRQYAKYFTTFPVQSSFTINVDNGKEELD